tara:strand:+ start:938 stop:1900 length:963 start_codon:yes stop_codon:yes gene_type:complete
MNQNEEAKLLLGKRLADAPQLAKGEQKDDQVFRDRCYDRWKDGLDLLVAFITTSEDLGQTILKREKQAASRKNDHKFAAAFTLHARGLMVSKEILSLLRNGFPDGALSRWRSLHEIAVVATLLKKNDAEVAQRFLEYRGIEECKALEQFAEYHERLGIEPPRPEDMSATKTRRNFLVGKFGEEFGKENGWAYPIIKNKEGTPRKPRIPFDALEKAAELDHCRPFYKWASDVVHAGPKPPWSYLGTSEVPPENGMLLTGSSDSGFTDPAQFCAISLNLVNHAIPEQYLTDFEKTCLDALRLWSDLISEVFFEIEFGDSQQS